MQRLPRRAGLIRAPHSRNSELSTALRRSARFFLIATLATAVVALAVLAGSASAYDPEHYDDPAYAAALTSMAAASGAYAGASLEAGMNVGGGYASASQAAQIRSALARARWASKVLPAARGLGAIGLGYTAFEIGWKIGRTLDTKFLHLSDLAPEEIGYGDTYGLVHNSNPWEWRFDAGTSEWRLTAYSEYGYPCGELDTIPSTFPGTLVSFYGVDRTTCQQFLLDAFISLSSVVGTVGTTQSVSCPSTFFGSPYTGTPAACFQITASEASMENYLASKIDVFADWSSQSFDRLTSGYDPSYSAQGFASQAAQNAAFANVLSAAVSDSPGEFVDHALNPTGTVPNPLIDFQIPGCWGLSVSDCEDAISEAADEVDQTVSFNVTTAPSENPDVARNLVLSTFPAASSMTRVDEVDITENPGSASQKTCKTETDRPHPSAHNPTMQAVGRVKCNYTGTAIYSMWMWECSSNQTSDPEVLYDDVFGGAFGCALRESISAPAQAPPVQVTAMSLLQEGGTEIYCPNLDEGQSYVSWGSGFWIAASVTTNSSPIQNYPPSISAPGWQPAAPDPPW